MAVPRCKKKKKFAPLEVEKRKIVKANQLAMAISLYYLGAEHGWKDGERLSDYFDAFCGNLDYCQAISNAYAASGACWNAGILLRKLGFPKGVDRVIHIEDDYTYEASQLTMAVALKTLKDIGEEEMLAEFEEAYLSLFWEVMTPKLEFNTTAMVEWCKEVTGVNIKEVVKW